MKLKAIVFVTLDNVYQGPGAPDEDRRGGFERGGWQGAHAGEEDGAFIMSTYEGADALLLGRVTWSIWERFWPNHDDNAIGHIINTLPKYVPTTAARDTTWQNTHFVERGDEAVEAAIRDLKAKPGRDLLVQGSGALVQWLLERDLVDELDLLIYPVLVGDGLRLFPEHGQTHDLELVESRSTPTGVTIQTYRPNGRARFESIEA